MNGATFDECTLRFMSQRVHS
jgi:hypothetical protein